jgi:hypothetical protein
MSTVLFSKILQEPAVRNRADGEYITACIPSGCRNPRFETPHHPTSDALKAILGSGISALILRVPRKGPADAPLAPESAAAVLPYDISF